MKQQKRDQLLTTPAAAKLLGVTDDQFRGIARRLNLQPASSYTNPKYCTAPRCPLWPPETINGLISSPEVAAAHERSRKLAEGRKRKPGERRAAIAKRYPNWRDAIPAAAEGMFTLNRYAKWKSCQRDHREEIYMLKNRFVQLVYSLNLCVTARIHRTEKPALNCRSCHGDGVGVDGEDCDRCDGTGLYRDASVHESIVFQFLIDGQSYCWHQPRELVNWEVSFTDQPEEWDGEADVKPLKLPPRKFADLKALMRFVLEERKDSPSTKRIKHEQRSTAP